jgi:hypothetical protein
MARAVEALGAPEVRPVIAARPVAAVPAVQPVGRAVPLPVVVAVVPLRGQLAELCASMALVTLFAALVALLWAAIGRTDDLSEIGTSYFLIVALSWAVLVPAKLWTQPGERGDSWARRITMMVFGAAIGLGALWLDGWVPDLPRGPEAAEASQSSGAAGVLGAHGSMAEAAGYMSYFALAFFALRWWKLADRRRTHRFSLAPILASGFWGAALLALVWPQWRAAIILMAAAAIVQLVSPWDPPPAAQAKRVRLRYA